MDRTDELANNATKYYQDHLARQRAEQKPLDLFWSHQRDR